MAEMSWNVRAYGKAWTGEREDTEFIVGKAGERVVTAIRPLLCGEAQASPEEEAKLQSSSVSSVTGSTPPEPGTRGHGEGSYDGSAGSIPVSPGLPSDEHQRLCGEQGR